MSTKKKSNVKKFSVSLPEQEGRLLKLYADDFGISRPMAIRRMVRECLRQYSKAKGELAPANQLDLFDSVQIDIFDDIAKSDQ